LFQSVPICQVQGFLAIIAYAMNLVGFGETALHIRGPFRRQLCEERRASKSCARGRHSNYRTDSTSKQTCTLGCIQEHFPPLVYTIDGPEN
jgi:hypothetical protein